MPGNGTWVEKTCDCDTCRIAGVAAIARFDAKMTRGTWGNFCPMCWMRQCQPALGTGIGQMLIREGENPREIATQLGVDDLVIVGGPR